MDHKSRLDNLRKIFLEQKTDAFLVSQPDNLYYLSGCEGLEGYLLITAQSSIIVTDFRYIEQAERQSPDCEIFRITGKMSEWLPHLLQDKNLHHLGFESQHLSYSAYQQISEIIEKSQMSIKLISTSNVVESLRVVKDKEEIALISQAAKITDASLKHVSNILHAGITEKELAWEIEKYMRENGSQTVPFELIVAAGPNAALPHARPSDYVIHAGEPIVVDIGSKYKFYGSDLTRTFVVGQPDAKFREVYDTVLKAQIAAISRIEAGMTGAAADDIARDIIAQAGYGETFGHSLGHGIGLVTHENPRVGMNSNDVLTDGMVFTIEPGIYVSGWGGVRIEDDVIMEKGRLRVISSAEK